MSTPRTIRSWALTATAVGLLSACGGGDAPIAGSTDPAGAPSTKGSFTAVVMFGDSLSDAGTYAPATSLAGNGTAPYFGGKFTANSATAKVWVENVAATLGIALTPAEVGYGASSVKCPAAATPGLAGSCTAYGQGGSRVTDPDGLGKAAGALTVPMKTQIANHLARFSSFRASDLILVWGGNNDISVQFSAFSATAAQIQSDAAAGRITADQAKLALFQAQTAGELALKAVAYELAGYVKSEILAKGGQYVAVLNLADATQTPYGNTLPAAAGPVLIAFVDTFNLWLKEALAGQPVKLVDQNAAGKAIHANPAAYGFVNISEAACDAAKIAVVTHNDITTGSSLYCNSTPGAPYNGLRSGADINTWQFADSVHPTPGGHKAISDYVMQQLKGYGWI